MTLMGEFQDTIRDGGAGSRSTRVWRCNRIVSTAWPLIAARLRDASAVRGIVCCAFGSGDERWDRAAPTVTPDTRQLAREVARVAIASDQVRYVDAVGQPSADPTHRLELAVTLIASAPLVVREFGLFGGEATALPDSGRLINYAIHPRVDLTRGARLTRRIRLSFRPEGAAAADELSMHGHWISTEPAQTVDGVGPVLARELGRQGVTTVADLAALDVTRRPAALALAKAIELRAKARLTLRAVAHPSVIAGLDDITLAKLLQTPATALPPTAPAAAVEALQEKLALLQLALGATFLERTRLGQLNQPTRQ
jgi:hypothetical protein